ncbi:MAG: histidine triad nucleotide-binding protein [Anaerolineales bacterium]
MDPTCTFCSIITRDTPGTIVFQDDLVVAFLDIHSAAPIHILIVPREHIASIDHLTNDHADLIGHMFIVARQLAKANDIAESGYRLIINSGPDANQTVFHLHLHLLGGRPMRYPMG